MSLNKFSGVYIPSVDAKDLYMSSGGYTLRRTNGELNTRKFINTLDYSLDLLKLEEVYYKVYRNSRFAYEINNHRYTSRVINVTFKYSCKAFNRCGGKTYIKFGHNPKSVIFDDCACVKDGVLIGVKTGETVKSPLPEEILAPYFEAVDGKYRVRMLFRTEMSVGDLRKSLYNDGFTCDGIEYVRWKRSSGSSRVGKCLFIDKNLYQRIHKWETCGLKVRQNQDIDLAAFESYISLTSSSSVDTLEINKENILVIDDYSSRFTDDVIVTDIDSGRLRTYESCVNVENNIWDGQSLMDESLFEHYGKYGMLLLRNRFFKSACFKTRIQKWFKDNGVTDISQLKGFTLAKHIEDIKLITTPSSIKFLKFGTVQQWLGNLESTFGVVKHDKPTHYFGGRMVQIHYQLLNTLQLSCDDVKRLIKPSVDYLDLIKTDPAVLRYHIKYPDEAACSEAGCGSADEIVYKLLGINDRFYDTRICRNFIRKTVKSYRDRLRHGHILVNGNYSVLFGNPLEMLKSAIGKFNGESSIAPETICSTRFLDGEDVLGSRSPHVTMGNILLSKNKYYKDIFTYFGLSREIVCINSIGENTLERLSGADFDSDTMLLTNNKILIDAARKNYRFFKVPTSKVEAKKIKRKYNAEQLADLDIKTSVNLIGEIINFSQDLNSTFWDNISKGESFEENRELYLDICQLDVMSCIEIDSAKKEFDISNKAELKALKEKYHATDENSNLVIKPKFFEMLGKTKGYNTNTKHYKKYNTSMDYLQTAIRKHRLPPFAGDDIPFSEIVNKDGYSRAYVKMNQIDAILSLVRGYRDYCSGIWEKEHLSGTEKFLLCQREKEELIAAVSGMKLSYDTMIKLLQTIDYPENKDIAAFVFSILFSAPHKDFYSLIENSRETQEILEERGGENLKIFDFTFKKVQKVC